MKNKVVKDIKELFVEDQTWTIGQLRESCSERGISEKAMKKGLMKLKKTGDIFETKEGVYCRI